jgi:primosomal protein N'
LGDLDLSEYLCRYRDCELTLIIAATGQAKEGRVVCGICGFALDGASDCPRCKLIAAEVAKGIRRRQEEQAALFREVEDILRGKDDG